MAQSLRRGHVWLHISTVMQSFTVWFREFEVDIEVLAGAEAWLGRAMQIAAYWSLKRCSRDQRQSRERGKFSRVERPIVDSFCLVRTRNTGYAPL